MPSVVRRAGVAAGRARGASTRARRPALRCGSRPSVCPNCWRCIRPLRSTRVVTRSAVATATDLDAGRGARRAAPRPHGDRRARQPRDALARAPRRRRGRHRRGAARARVGRRDPARHVHTAASRVLEWCDRRLLARIHRYTLNRLRAEIAPVSPAEFMRFLFTWQHVEPASRLAGSKVCAPCSRNSMASSCPRARGSATSCRRGSNATSRRCSTCCA